jgi:hypothetical protein
MASVPLGNPPMTKISTEARRFQVTKELVDHDVAGPDTSPLHVNHFQVSHGEGDWYVDVGTIPIDDMLKKGAESVRFLVTQRLVMSLPSIKKLRDQIADVLGKAEGSADESPDTKRKESTTARTKATKTRRTKG